MRAKKRLPDKAAWDRVHKQNYAGRVSDWSAWLATADELQFAAELIKPRVIAWWVAVNDWNASTARPRTFPALGCHSILMMLFAFVVENLCKGSLIRDGHVDTSPWTLGDSRLPKELNTHDLRRLVRKVGFTLDELEEELLARLTRAAVWRGRYPVAARYDEAIHTVCFDDGRKYSAAWFGENDVARVESLVSRLREHLRTNRSFTVARDAAP